MTANELFESEQAIIRNTARALGFEPEELMLEAYEAAVWTVENFDPEKGTSYGALFNTVVYHHMANGARKLRRHEAREISIEDMTQYDQEAALNVEVEATSNVDVASLLSKVTNEVSRDLVWKVLAEGWSQLEAAEFYGISQQTASRRIAEAMSEIRG